MIRVFSDYAVLSEAVAEEIVAAGRRALARHDRFDLFLAGGESPQGAYVKLATKHAGERGLWEETHVFWGDERCVPPDDSESNYAVAKRLMLDRVPIPPMQVHRMEGESADPDRAAAEYEALLPAAADLILLGMGAEGHIASLFPRSSALDEAARRVVAVAVETLAEPKYRLTITPPVLSAARQVVVVVSGAEKAAAVARVFAEPGHVQETPARLVRDRTWLVDREAAGDLANAQGQGGLS